MCKKAWEEEGGGGGSCPSLKWQSLQGLRGPKARKGGWGWPSSGNAGHAKLCGMGSRESQGDGGLLREPSGQPGVKGVVRVALWFLSLLLLPGETLLKYSWPFSHPVHRGR